MKYTALTIVLIASALTACQPLLSGDTPKTIPDAMQGDWGLTANDCDPAFDPRKGLMTVTADTLTFYESRATLTEVTDGDEGRIRARYAFTGEGQDWTVDMTLALEDDGATLIRTDHSGTDLPAPLSYRACTTG